MLTCTGVITKPDALVPGSKGEEFYASLSRNEKEKLLLGWHVLKNADTDKGIATLANRDADEKEFFSKGIWKQVPGHLLGITELNSRLKNVLLKLIGDELPNITRDMNSKLGHCQEQLDSLGQPREKFNEQLVYLLKVSQMFQSLVKASIDGTYSGSFFENPTTDRGYAQRIRAVVQNLNRDFAKELSERGHYRQLISGVATIRPARGVIGISRDEFVDHIQEVMRRTRGRELSCTFSPMIVAALFLEQSSPWRLIVQEHVKKVWEAAKSFLLLVCVHILDDTAAKHLISEIVDPAMDNIIDSMRRTTKELLQPHQDGHPITYNQEFIETFQKSQGERRKNEVIDALRSEFYISAADCGSASYYMEDRIINFAGLVDSLAKRSESDMDRFVASEALDCMEAYYKANNPTSVASSVAAADQSHTTFRSL